MKPPMPDHRPNEVSFFKYLRLFRRDILSAQPSRLYRAWMAEYRTPFFRSFLINQPDLVKLVLKERPDDFPKSDRVSEGLKPLLGRSVFLTNGDEWKAQRRIIDPAFAGGRLKDTFPAMLESANSCVARLNARSGQIVEIEAEMSHATADVIFRTLFSIPIENDIAAQVFKHFKTYQRTQPVVNIGAFLPLPRWMPRFFKRDTIRAADSIRGLIRQLVEQRLKDIEAGRAPDDLATKIMTMKEPETGHRFTVDEMVDQVAVFFLAGHETSASALSWALYLLATHPDWQDRVAAEAETVLQEGTFNEVAKLRIARDVFRETLRLYPPVPMMVRQAQCSETMRDRDVPVGSQVVLSPWHIHRQERLWENPHDFEPSRWDTENGRQCMRDAFIPFSEGTRVCPGAGFAMIEGPLLLAMILKNFSVKAQNRPIPVAHLTVRAKEGVYLTLIAK